MAGKCKKTINSQDGFTAQTHKVLVLPSPFDLINQIRKILLQAITFFLKKSFFFFLIWKQRFYNSTLSNLQSRKFTSK